MRVLLVVYDNGSYIHWFPQGTAYIAAVLRRAGHEVTIWQQDIHHYPDEDLAARLDREVFDVVGIGVIAGYWQYRRLKRLSQAVNQSRNRPFFVLGGFGPSADMEYFLKISGADAAVHGEGELTILALLDALSAKTPLSEVTGIGYRDGETIHINRERPLIEDLDTVPFPAYDMFPIEIYRLVRFARMDSTDFAMPLLSGRGCTFRCTFCYRMDKGFRPRSNESVIEEVRLLNTDYRVNYIYFNDELLMNSKERVIEFSEAIIKSGLKFKWSCNGRLNYATPETMRVMREAGCVFINYGIEALDNDVLKNIKKGLRVEQIEEGIKTTLDADISPGFNIIFGNIGDSAETLRKGVEFLLKYDDGAQLRTIRPVTPYPGSPLYYTAIEQGKLEGCEDFYERKHVNSDLLAVNFTEMSDDDFHMALLDANSQLLRNYYARTIDQSIRQLEELYTGHNPDFRGFRHG